MRVEQEGWAQNDNHSKFHYFVEGVSLCKNQWAHPGPYVFNREIISGECVLCTRKLRARLMRARRLAARR